MDIPLVAQCILAMRPDWGIEVVLDLQYMSVGWKLARYTVSCMYRLLKASLICKESSSTK